MKDEQESVGGRLGRKQRNVLSQEEKGSQELFLRLEKRLRYAGVRSRTRLKYNPSRALGKIKTPNQVGTLQEPFECGGRTYCKMEQRLEQRHQWKSWNGCVGVNHGGG